MAVRQNSRAPRSRGAASTGLIVVDRRGKPIYFNSEALKLLCFPHGCAEPLNLMHFLPAEIREAMVNGSFASSGSVETGLRSGKRNYRCRVYPLVSGSKDPHKVTTAILIDRLPSKSAKINVIEIAEEFNLTEREQETVHLLTEGLTSKEIAARMNISPNTVKTFMHLVMAKMAVPTRSAILGKILRG